MSNTTTRAPVALGSRILVQQHEAEAESEGGIIIPDKAQERNNLGVVLGVGDKVTKVKTGDEIFYQNLGVVPFTIGGVTVLIMDEDDVLLKFEEVDDA